MLQPTRTHTLHAELIEFLVVILGGCAYLQDIGRGPHPLDEDPTVAKAWGQPGWADYSGVSRTLNACGPKTVAALRQAIVQVCQPFVDREVVRSVQQAGKLAYDGDLTGWPVSSRSTTHEVPPLGGWMMRSNWATTPCRSVGTAPPTGGSGFRWPPIGEISCPAVKRKRWSGPF